VRCSRVQSGPFLSRQSTWRDSTWRNSTWRYIRRVHGLTACSHHALLLSPADQSGAAEADLSCATNLTSHAFKQQRQAAGDTHLNANHHVQQGKQRQRCL